MTDKENKVYDTTKCKYQTFDGGRDLVICTHEQHPYICEQVKDCIYKQLLATQKKLVEAELSLKGKTQFYCQCGGIRQNEVDLQQKLDKAVDGLEKAIFHLHENFDEIETKEVGKAYYTDDNTFEDNLRELETTLEEIKGKEQNE